MNDGRVGEFQRILEGIFLTPNQREPNTVKEERKREKQPTVKTRLERAPGARAAGTRRLKLQPNDSSGGLKTSWPRWAPGTEKGGALPAKTRRENRTRHGGGR